MKLSMRLAGLFGSGVFILTALPGFVQHVRPSDVHDLVPGSIQGMDILESLGFSLLGMVVAGVIGFIIGDILSKPKGSNDPRRKGKAQAAKPRHAPVAKPVTGDETFLDDLEPAPVSASPEPPMAAEVSVGESE